MAVWRTVGQTRVLRQGQPGPAHPELQVPQPQPERHRRPPEYQHLVAARQAAPALMAERLARSERVAAQCSRPLARVLYRSPPPVPEEHRLLPETSHREIQGAE